MITHKSIPHKVLSQSSPALRPLTGLPFIDIDGMTARGERRATNEDSFLTAELTRSLTLGPSSLALRQGEILSRAVQGKLLAVADGISGAGAGAVASNIALRFMAGYMTNVMEWLMEDHDNDDHDNDDRMQEELEVAFQRCQKRIRGEARRLGYEDHPVGTTLTMAYIVWPRIYLAHVGDSRAYLYRDKQLMRLTTEHTLAQRMVDRQLMDVEEADLSRFDHILTNAVGGAREAVEVEYRSLELQGGDAVLLCTDGLVEHVEEHEIKFHIERSITSETCCRQLIALAAERGGGDNMTVVLGRLDSPTHELQRARRAVAS